MCSSLNLAQGFLLSAAIMAFGSKAGAATVIMENGERFEGRITSMIDGELVLQNQYAGKITLPWSDVAELISDEELRVQLPDERVVSSSARSATPGSVELDDLDPGEEKSLPLGDIASINRPEVDPYKYDWSGKSNVGLNATTGNSDTTRYHVDGEVRRENDLNRYVAGIDFNRGSDSGTTNVDNWTAYANYDRFFSDKLFSNNTVSFKRNTLQQLDLRTAVGTGIGYQILSRPGLRLSTTSGLSYVREQFDLVTTEEFAAFQFGINYEHQWFEWLRFFHNLDTLTSLENTADFVLRARTGLRYPISDNFVASLQVNVDYDNTPSPGAESEDIIYTFTLGYSF